MAEGRGMARGRSERTPVRLLITVIVVVAVFVGVLWAIVALVQAVS